MAAESPAAAAASAAIRLGDLSRCGSHRAGPSVKPLPRRPASPGCASCEGCCHGGGLL
jgi:hypothetical protein